MILFNKWRLAIVTGRYMGDWLSFRSAWDYHNIIVTFNVLTYDLTIEFVHYGWFNKQINKGGFGFGIDRNQ